MENEKLESSAMLTDGTIYEPYLSQDHPVSDPVFAVCLQNDGYTVSLERYKIYRVLPDEEALEDHELRIVDESGEDYLYPDTWFAPIELPQAVEKALLATA